jgi:hypothetical protein
MGYSGTRALQVQAAENLTHFALCAAQSCLIVTRNAGNEAQINHAELVPEESRSRPSKADAQKNSIHLHETHQVR